MPKVDQAELARMRASVFFEGPEAPSKRGRYWMLLLLSATIASAGVVADSTATVIGAMIVAPMMTPTLGVMLSVMLTDRGNLLRSVGLVVGGAAATIAIGFLVGLLHPSDIVAANNSQVAARIHPRDIDLLAALATGVVGALALARGDIADTLPGVAIAIALVPPLAVAGLTAKAGAFRQSAGALLLFATNVAAILMAGIIVMAIHRLHDLVATPAGPQRGGISRRKGILIIVAMFVAIAGILTASTITIGRNAAREAKVRSATTKWAEQVGWGLVSVTIRDEDTIVRVIGPPPWPSTSGLEELLQAEGVEPSHVTVEFIPETRVELGSTHQPSPGP